MSELLTLKGTNGVSEIHIESGLLARAASVIGETFSPSRIHIVSDSTVAPLYLEQLEQQFTLPVTHTVIPAGEEHKRLSTVEGIYHDLLASGMTRKDLIIALGGGVVGDITGFAAATFLRGVSLCQIPTTLLAQVDSSVGGKTGVDMPEGKNLVGAFYQPRLVLIDPAVLATLPDQTFADGMAEVIKYGCIRDAAVRITQRRRFRASSDNVPRRLPSRARTLLSAVRPHRALPEREASARCFQSRRPASAD